MLPGTGLPRLLDMGQCNDAYSALVVATVRCVVLFCYVVYIIWHCMVLVVVDGICLTRSLVQCQCNDVHTVHLWCDSV
jgi:hypothetical protein